VPRFKVSLRRLTHPVTIAFALLLVVGLALSALINAQRKEHADVQRAMDVREAIMALRLSIDESQNSIRGYILTGGEDFLESYNAAKDLLPLQVSNLRTLTADNPRHQATLEHVGPRVEELIRIFAARVETMRTQGREAILSMGRAGKVVTDELAGFLETMAEEESRLLLERQAAAERSAMFIQVLVVISLLAAITFGLLNAIEGSRQRKAIKEAHEKLLGEVAERGKIEEQLRQSQKMEAVGQLTGGVAHDFNNMLAVVIGALDIARKRLSQGNTNIEKLIENAMDGAKRGALLTQRLLAFSRQQALEPKLLDVNRLVATLSDLLRRTLGEDIIIEVVQGAGLWRVLADGPQLENALLNLAVNGRDAMPQGGRLTIETTNITLDEHYATAQGIAPGPYVMICVSDTGGGMTPEIMARAFDPFFTTKDVGQGTGLGLSQVFGFVKQSGGHVKIYSEPKHGTTVKIYLRRHESDDPSMPAANAPPPEKDVSEGHRPAVVLAVEDEDTVRLLTVASLEELGYTVLAAANGKDALDILEQHSEITLLLTDVVMPEMTGRQLAEEAVRRRPGLKVLFTTGYTRNAIVHNGTLDAGVQLLSKPFTLQQLSQAMHRVMGSRER
jgi:signal transduction histidine kinase/CheY-like chemotaxis protein